jgi:deoxycytidine triphosphate deaminase
MVLAKSKIIEAVEGQKIVIKSVIEGYDYKMLLGPNSLDLTLGRFIKVYKGYSGWRVVDLSKQDGGFQIEKGDLILGVTNEWIFCDGFYPSLRDKSSMGRNFATAINGGAGSGDNRFAGHYTLEIKGDIPLTLTYGMLIAQIIFHQTVGDGDYSDGGRYANEFTGEHPTPEECKGFKNVFDIIKAKASVVDSGFKRIEQKWSLKSVAEVETKPNETIGEEAKPEECDVSRICYIYGIQDSFGRIKTQVVDFVGESITLGCKDQEGCEIHFDDDALHLRDWCKANNLKYLFKEVQIGFDSSEFETV